MTTTVPSITTLKSAKSLILKKTLIVVAASAGLIAAGALTFAVVSAEEKDTADSE